MLLGTNDEILIAQAVKRSSVMCQLYLWNIRYDQVTVRNTSSILIGALLRQNNGQFCFSDSTIASWNPFTGEIRDIGRHDDHVTSLRQLPNGAIVSGACDGTVRIWNNTGGEVARMTEHCDDSRMQDRSDWIVLVEVLPDGSIVSGGANGKVVHWHPGQEKTSTMDAKPIRVNQLVSRSDGSVVVSSHDGEVLVWYP
jgi:WD40 repeat protein